MKPRARFGAMGEGCVIERPGPFLWNADRIRLGARVRIGRESRLQVNLESGVEPCGIDLGDDVVIGAACQLSASLGIAIGPGTRIGEEVLITDNTHSYENVSTPIPLQRVRPVGPVRIGSGAIIGRGAVILGGVTIGDGAVVVDRAVIHRDVAPGEWVAGCQTGRITLPRP